jgi:hypothetical protein
MQPRTIKQLAVEIKTGTCIVVTASSAYGSTKAYYQVDPFEYIPVEDDASNNLSGFNMIHGKKSMEELDQAIFDVNLMGCDEYDGCHLCTLSARIESPKNPFLTSVEMF